MRKNYWLIATLLMTTSIFTGCDKPPPPPPPPEEEVITTLNYTLTPADAGTAVTLSFKDLDGDGSVDPTITGGTLVANQTYTGTLELLNESVSPTDNITIEIEEEDEAHQFFFLTTIRDLDIYYKDEDADGNPIGLNNELFTGAPASGNITVILRHEPNKFDLSAKAGDPTNAGGETDIEVTFPIDVE